MISGNRNGNWKGGLTKFRTADELLNMPEQCRAEVYRRLLSNYEEDSVTKCWNWTAGIMGRYNQAKLTLGYKHHIAYRLMYVLSKGSTGGLKVLHTCDNPTCINPEHLWLGTNADNSADMTAKGRHAPQQGSLNNYAKLTEDIVVVIKQRLRNGEKQNRIADELNMSKQTINLIAIGKTWRHIEVDSSNSATKLPDSPLTPEAV